MKKHRLFIIALGVALMVSLLGGCNTLRVEPNGSVVFWEKKIPLKKASPPPRDTSYSDPYWR